MSDGELTTETSFNLTIAPVNDLPVLSDLSFVVEEDGLFSISDSVFLSSFNDIDNVQMSRITITSLPSHGDIYFDGSLVNANEEILFNQLDSITYQPDVDYFGDDIFTWNAYDGVSYALDSAIISITVLPVNDAPGIQTIE